MFDSTFIDPHRTWPSHFYHDLNPLTRLIGVFKKENNKEGMKKAGKEKEKEKESIKMGHKIYLTNMGKQTTPQELLNNHKSE